MNIKDYEFDEVIIRYITDENKKTSMLLIPKSLKNKAKKPWDKGNVPPDPRARYNPRFEMGSLAHFHLKGDNLSRSGITMKESLSEKEMEVKEQVINSTEEKTEIKTSLVNDMGIVVIHTLTKYKDSRTFIVETEFINNSGKDVVLEMLTSFSLDNLSVFAEDDGPNRYMFHRFYGGWSKEGKHISALAEELGLEKSWAGYMGQNEKFGCVGSFPVNRYFPVAAFEDKESGAVWIAQLSCNSTWQMELTRCGDAFSFSGGVGDNDFCGWSRTVKNGEAFMAPKAYIAAVDGDIDDACDAVLDIQRRSCKTQSGLPVVFNEYCATWGEPTQEKMSELCDTLKNFDVDYLVIDAGWCKKGFSQMGNGEWQIDKSIFPNMKKLNEEIRNNGVIPGIWMEFEVTTDGSVMFESKYDDMHLKHNGNVIKTNGVRSYWDFRRTDVIEYLTERVINFLKEYDFGYLKVDYNGNIGGEADGPESGVENLRIQMEAVREFFKKIKESIPELIIENCASGGHRLEPSMMEITDVSSFSDAHECVEIPYVAANLHRLMLPEKELIWAVLHKDDSEKRMVYSLAATFLGRMCLSGNISELDSEQNKILKDAIDFYGLLENVIKHGKTRIFGNRGTNMRYPTGTQIVVRRTENQIMVVVHNFENPMQNTEIDIPNGYNVVRGFHDDDLCLSDGKIVISDMKEFSACAVLLEKND